SCTQQRQRLDRAPQGASAGRCSVAPRCGGPLSGVGFGASLVSGLHSMRVQQRLDTFILARVAQGTFPRHNLAVACKLGEVALARASFWEKCKFVFSPIDKACLPNRLTTSPSSRIARVNGATTKVNSLAVGSFRPLALDPDANTVPEG